MSWLAAVGFGAVGVVVLGWLAASFSAPGARRERIESSAASALYVALLSLFVHLLRKALAADSAAGIAAFGFLVTFFSFGLLVSLVQTAGSFRAPRARETSATN